jgi:NAD(P)-dependent dehydrogenase (short-subunit alcohol dehydrogenase family)
LCQQKKQFMTTIFNNQQIVVAGGASGIGLSAAIHFKAQGGIVTVTGRNAEKLAAAQQQGLTPAQVDSAERKALDNFFNDYGPIDHLVISLSGSKGMGNFADLSLQVLREGFEEKFWANLHTVQAALPYIKKAGSITLVTAISGIAKLPGTSGLGAINGALEIMAQVWAKEFDQIRVNAVSPGVVDTGWWDFLPADKKEETFAEFSRQIKVGRVGKPEEIAQAILFAAGNNYMTGKVIACDGGLS